MSSMTATVANGITAYVIVPFARDNYCFLLFKKRVPYSKRKNDNATIWHLPSVDCQEDEEPYDAIQRELKDRAGIKMEEIVHLFKVVPARENSSRKPLHFYLWNRGMQNPPHEETTRKAWIHISSIRSNELLLPLELSVLEEAYACLKQRNQQ